MYSIECLNFIIYGQIDTNVRTFTECIINKGFEIGGNSHIVPMVCGSNENSVEMAELLQDNGFFALPVRYPTASQE